MGRDDVLEVVHNPLFDVLELLGVWEEEVLFLELLQKTDIRIIP